MSDVGQEVDLQHHADREWAEGAVERGGLPLYAVNTLVSQIVKRRLVAAAIGRVNDDSPAMEREVDQSLESVFDPNQYSPMLIAIAGEQVATLTASGSKDPSVIALSVTARFIEVAEKIGHLAKVRVPLTNRAVIDDMAEQLGEG